MGRMGQGGAGADPWRAAGAWVRHITSVALPGRVARKLLRELDREGICIGLGSACTGCETEVSHVLKAVGVPAELAEGTLRFSLGWYATQGFVDDAIALLGRC